MNDDEPKIIESPLNGRYTRDGITVDVNICRLENETEWTLEIVDADWNSIVWDDKFPTYQDAYKAFLSDVEREGLVNVMAGMEPPTLN